MMMSSRSEQLHMNSSFFKPVPDGAFLTVDVGFWLNSTTLVTSMVSKFLISVLRGWFFPYLPLEIFTQTS